MGSGSFNPGAYAGFTKAAASKTTDEVFSSRDYISELERATAAGVLD